MLFSETNIYCENHTKQAHSGQNTEYVRACGTHSNHYAVRVKQFIYVFIYLFINDKRTRKHRVLNYWPQMRTLAEMKAVR